MNMNVDKLFEAAVAAGLEIFEAHFTTEDKTSIQTFNGEVEVYTVAGNGAMKLRGVAEGKCGSFASDRVDNEVIPVAIAAVRESAEYGQAADSEAFIKPDAYKYEKVETYYPALEKIPPEQLVELAKTLAKKAFALDKRFNNINTEVEYSHDTHRFKNSHGLDISAESNLLTVVISGDAKQGEEVQSGFNYDIITDFSAFDADKFVQKFVDDVMGQFGGETVATGKYDIVYDHDCVVSFLSALGGAFSAFDVEQHISLLEGKVGKKIFSELLTIEEKPIGSGPFCCAFDAEGVPCTNKVLVDKGVPTGYVYDLATAKRAGVQSTGNGRARGSNVRPAVGCCTVAPGESSLEELFARIGNGLYITDLGGVHSGLNAQSGAYSLQASGFVIENGKLGRPVSLITVASNIMDDFKNIIAVGNDSRLTYHGITTPSMAIGGVSVSGK